MKRLVTSVIELIGDVFLSKTYVHSVSKTIHLTFDHNVGKCRPIFKFFHYQIPHETLHVTTTISIPYHLNYVATPPCEIQKFKIMAEHYWTHTIKINNQFYLKLNKTEQCLDNKRYKNITVIIYVIFVQQMKHKVQITLERSEYLDDELREVSATNDFPLSEGELFVSFVTNGKYLLQSTYLIKSWKIKLVLKTSISSTNTSSQTFTPFTGASFINDCLLQLILHINHPLLQFTDIMHPLLSTAALFSYSKLYSHKIQIWAIKAASYLARWILRSHMQ